MYMVIILKDIMVIMVIILLYYIIYYYIRYICHVSPTLLLYYYITIFIAIYYYYCIILLYYIILYYIITILLLYYYYIMYYIEVFLKPLSIFPSRRIGEDGRSYCVAPITTAGAFFGRRQPLSSTGDICIYIYIPFHIWDVIFPIDELIFFKMVKTTNHMYIYLHQAH